MNRQYAATQVCQLTLARYEIEKIVVDNLLARGGDPSYDFATGHPIFIWADDGGLAIRFVQAAVTAKEQERWFTLRPAPTAAEIDKMLEERRAKIKAA